jgi:protein ImuB
MWDIELLRRPRRSARSPAVRNAAPRQPTLLVAPSAGQQLVARCDMLAARQGVAPGMALAEARALSPTALVLNFDAKRSAQMLERLARWMLRYSPKVGLDPSPLGTQPEPSPDGLLLDITGEAHLFGSEHLLLMEIAQKLTRAGFTARLAAAPTLGAAWALARFDPHPLCVVDAHQLLPALQPLPIAALRLPPKLIASLQQIGLERIDHLLALRRESLLTRYGDSLLQRLDQALGRSAEDFTPLRLEEPLAVQRIFEGAATQLEAVTRTVQDLLAELTARLLQRESGIRGLRLTLTRADAPPVSLEILLGRPSRDPKHLWSLLRPKVETLHLGYGVEAVTLTAFWTETIRHRQIDVWGNSESGDNQALEELLDTLVNRWGSQRVLQAQACPSHLPESARQFTPVRRDQRPAPSHGQATLLFADRPSIMLAPPEPAEALALQPDHPPSWLRWRGQDHTLAAGTGPERILPEWWTEPTPGPRDYYKVQTDRGLWLWVYRETETAHWFVHGLWT